MNGAFAFLVATAFDQVAHQERAAARQVAADAELLLGWLRARPAAPTLKELAQRAPLLLRDKSRRSRALAWLLRKGRARRERRGKATVLVAT